MANNIKGITIEFDGKVSKLQKALSTVKKASSDTFKELNKINNGLKFNPSNIELIGMKHKKLQDRVKETADKLELLKSADEKAKAQLAKGDLSQDEYNKLRREIIETESKLKNFKKEVESLPNVKIEALGAKFEQVGKKLEKVGSKITSIGTELTTKLTLPLVGIGTVSFKSAADLQDAMGATEQIFGDASDSMKDWASGIESYYGIAEGEALEYSNTMGAMLQNIGGLSETEAAKQAQTLTELAGDLSAMFGGSTQDAINALTGALKGNTTMLDNYGMGVNDATIKAKAFEMGLYSGTGAMDLQTKQAATLALIMEQTGAAQGQASRESDGASGSMKALTTTIKDLSTNIGEVLLPIITPMIQKISEWIEKFKALSPETQNMIVKIGLTAAVIGPLLVVLGTLITTIGKVSIALKGIMLFANANPFILLATGIAAAVALIVKNWDAIKAKTSEVWNSVYTTISTKIKNAKNKVKSVVDSIKGFFNFKFKWPSIPMPHFGISPRGWKIGDLLKGSIPKLGIKWYAQGGIFDNPSLIGVGEAGSEAVIPTHKLDKFLEEGVNRVLNRVNGNQGQGIVINVNEMNVRDDNDIRLLAEEVLRRIDLKTNRKANAGGLA